MSGSSSKRKKKIIHIQKVTEISGSETHLLTLLPRLREYGYEPTMLCLSEYHRPPTNFVAKMEGAGIPTEVIWIGQNHFQPLLLPELTLKIKQGEYDLVHTHLIHADFYGILAARMAGVKVVISSRHNDNAFRSKFPWRWLISGNNRFADRLICISQHLKQFAETVELTAAEKISVVHYGLDPSKVSDQSWREKLGWEENVQAIGIVSRLTEQKGHSTLLKAMSEVVRQFPTVQLVIIGDGELRQNLEQDTVKLGLEKQVHFLGYRQDAAAMMSGLDLFVLPSRWEGFGLVLLEAMAARLPIVATKVSAIPEIVRHGETGLLVPVDDVDALSKAICTLLGQRHLARTMGENGRKRLEQNFTVQAMVNKTCAVYNQLLSAK